jgi:GABA permease
MQAGPRNRRILVVANGVVEGKEFRKVTGLRRSDKQHAEVRVISPALNSRLRHCPTRTRRVAEPLRLAATVESLCAAGIEADGRVGDADPLQAIADALVEFQPEEIVIATQPGQRSNWATRDLLGHARRRFTQSVVQIVTEPGEDAKTPLAPEHRRPAFAGSLACRGVEANA